jgi:hypothetical protein
VLPNEFEVNMELTNAITGLLGTLSNGLQPPANPAFPAAQSLAEHTGMALTTSSSATAAANGRVEAVIQSMTNLQNWNIRNDFIESTNLAQSGVMGSAGTLSSMMHENMNMLGGGTEVTHNDDGTVTVTTTVNHNPGVIMVLEQFVDDSVAPAANSAGWLTSILGNRGDTVADNMTAFSYNLPLQIPDYVQAGAASPALGASLVVNFPVFN